MHERFAAIDRQTRETSIQLKLAIDGAGTTDISTGFGFADHMLTLFAFWGGLDLHVACTGDMEIDAHHSLEDVGLTLGQAFAQALGGKEGIERVGFAKVPMDEALSEVCIDISGRPYFVYLGDDLLPPVIAGQEKDLWREFFKSFAYKANLNLHIRFEYGTNGHHLLESAFKGLGLAVRAAVARSRRGVTSTKGSLD